MINKFKRQLAITIAATTILSLPGSAFASTTFTDVKQSDWYYSTVTKLADTGIINGTGDGSFNPTGEVGIDAFVKMLFEAQNIQVDDVESDYWAEKYFRKAYTTTYGNILANIKCYYLGSVNQSVTSQPITREQMCGLIAKALEIDGNMSSSLFDSSMFSDYSSISKDYTTAVRTSVINGIMGGKDGGIFDPQATVTRAEAATVIARYLYPEERLQYTYSAKQESHNVGDVYTEYNIWPVPVEVKFYETNQAIPTISEVSMLYVEELGKYIYAGMPVSELEEIMGSKATKQEKFNNYYWNGISYSTSKDGVYIDSFTVCKSYNATFNSHSIGEKPMLEDEYVLRAEYDEIFSNGGAVDIYPIVRGIYEINGVKIIYHYINDGYTQAALDRWGIPDGTEEYHLPTRLDGFSIQGTTEINRTLGIE